MRPFSAVPDLLRRVRDAGLRVAIASSAKKDELDKYLDIARIADLVDLATSSDDVEESKPAPDIFNVVLKKLETPSRLATHPTMPSRPGRPRSRPSAYFAAGSQRACFDKPVASRYIPDRPRCSLVSGKRCSRGSEAGRTFAIEDAAKKVSWREN